MQSTHYQGKTLAEWTRDLMLPKATRRLMAAKVLAEIGAEATGTLITALQHKDPAVRYWAATGLRKAGSLPEEGTTALAALLNDPSGSVRIRAAEALFRLGLQTQALSKLAAALKDSNPRVRLYAVETLSRLAPGSPEAFALIQSASQDEDNYVARAVENALH
ncbi:MAG: HEAT repeat domain-containing protein [Acidobacteriota bacterium]